MRAYQEARTALLVGDALSKHCTSADNVPYVTGALTELTHLVERGSLRPVVDEIYPLERIADAHARLERGGVAGKVVIDR